MTKTFEKPFLVSNEEGYAAALQQLYEKISSVKKDISYLDVYNIVAVCDNKENFAAQINSLALNSSLVINAPSFNMDGINYATGDIILKTANDKIIQIKAQLGGIFKPTKLIKDGENYSIEYEFTKQIPIVKEEKTVTLEGIEPTTGSGAYGVFDKVGSFQKQKNTDGEVIKPYVKFYFVDDQLFPVEEVVCDYTIRPDTSTETEGFVITVTDSQELYMLVK